MKSICHKMDNIQFNDLVKREKAKYAELHEAKVYTRNGYTYIRFETVDILTEESTRLIHNLLDLMRVPYSLHYAKQDQLGDSFIETIIPGDDDLRASRIIDFIKNDYTLKW